MTKVVSTAGLSGLVAVGVVLFAFWPALFGGGSFVPDDIVIRHAAPFDFYAPEDFTVETDSTDPINIHSHWAPLASDVRSGEVGWWNPNLAGGQPTMKGGLPVFNLGYLVVPGWYGPGLVAALRALTAIVLTYGFVRSLGLLRVSALASGIAFAFCGFMLAWMNWPHSSVAALAPGLLWATEKMLRDPKLWRAVPLGAVVAAMVWSNFPQVTILVLLAALVYGAVRLPVELRDRNIEQPLLLTLVKRYALPLLAAVVLSILLAAPHLIGFAEYLEWGDTSYRDTSTVDSSADVKYLLTLVAPAIWGHGSFGPVWFGELGWNEPHVYAGASVAILALVGFVAGLGHGDRRCRAAVFALVIISTLGVLLGFVGGPITEPLRELAGDNFGAQTRAKLLLNLGVAVGAAFGIERLAVHKWSNRSDSLRNCVGIAALLGVLVAAALLPSGFVWWRAVNDEGVLREVLAASIVPALSALVVAAAIFARTRGQLTGPAVGWLLVAVVGYEMLSFMMPVHTVVERDERLTATPAHTAVREMLGPGERLAGEGWTFFPSTTALFDIDDARGHLIKSPGYNALLWAEVPDSLTLGKGRATPTWPYIPYDTDISSPVWDAMAVRVWAQFPNSLPPGTWIESAPATAFADPATEPIRTSLSSPPGGLRAVTIDVTSEVGGPLTVSIAAAGMESNEVREIPPHSKGLQSFAFAGDDLPTATPVSVSVTSPAVGRFLVGIYQSARLATGMVVGNDEFRLTRTGDVLLIERPRAEFVRIMDAAQVESDTQRAADAVAARTAGERSVVVNADLGLPESPSPNAQIEVVDVSRQRDRVEARVRSDRDAVVVFSVTRYPGWSAEVDGRPARIVTADAAFMAVFVPEGEHTVTIKFRPQHLGISLFLGASGILLALGLLCIGIYHRRPKAARAQLRASR